MLVTYFSIAEHLPNCEKLTSPQYCYRTNEEFIQYYVVLEKVVVWLVVFSVLVLTLNFEVGEMLTMQLPEK